MKKLTALLAISSLSFAQQAVGIPTADIFSNLIPKIDPVFAFVAVLGVIIAFVLLIMGALFLFAVKKNWIVLKWPYKITRFRPSGGVPMRSDDVGALITNDKGKMFMRLKSTGLNYEVPDRTYIQPGDYLYGWSNNIRELTFMKVNFVALMNKADPGVMNKIMACKDVKTRERLLEEYENKLKDYSINYRPVVSNSAINSAIDSAAEIVENSPKKIDFLPWLVVGGSIVMMLVTFLISGMLAMKGYDEGTQALKVDEAKANAEYAMANTLNSTNIINNRLADILNRSVINIPQQG
jgi:hypothetical protein